VVLMIGGKISGILTKVSQMGLVLLLVAESQ